MAHAFTKKNAAPKMVLKDLPVDKHLAQIVAAALDLKQITAVGSPTGSGKTLRIPHALAKAFPNAVVFAALPTVMSVRKIAETTKDLYGHELSVGSACDREILYNDQTRLRVVTYQHFFNRLVAMHHEGKKTDWTRLIGMVDECHLTTAEAHKVLCLVSHYVNRLKYDMRVLLSSGTLRNMTFAMFNKTKEGISSSWKNKPIHNIDLEHRLHPITTRWHTRDYDPHEYKLLIADMYLVIRKISEECRQVGKPCVILAFVSGESDLEKLTDHLSCRTDEDDTLEDTLASGLETYGETEEVGAVVYRRDTSGRTEPELDHKTDEKRPAEKAATKKVEKPAEKKADKKADHNFDRFGQNQSKASQLVAGTQFPENRALYDQKDTKSDNKFAALVEDAADEDDDDDTNVETTVKSKNHSNVLPAGVNLYNHVESMMVQYHTDPHMPDLDVLVEAVTGWLQYDFEMQYVLEHWTDMKLPQIRMAFERLRENKRKREYVLSMDKFDREPGITFDQNVYDGVMTKFRRRVDFDPSGVPLMSDPWPKSWLNEYPPTGIKSVDISKLSPAQKMVHHFARLRLWDKEQGRAASLLWDDYKTGDRYKPLASFVEHGSYEWFLTKSIHTEINFVNANYDHFVYLCNTYTKEIGVHHTKVAKKPVVVVHPKSTVEHKTRPVAVDPGYATGNPLQFDVRWACSSLPKEELNKVYDPVIPGYIKVILATNVAQTAITLPDVTHVVNGGYEKRPKQMDPHDSRFISLVLEPSSQSSQLQRAGRAGRTGPGEVYHMMTEERFKALPEHDMSDFDRLPQQIPCLEMMANGFDPVDVYGIEEKNMSIIVHVLSGLTMIEKTNKKDEKQQTKKIDPFVFKNVSYRVTDLGRSILKYNLPIEQALFVHALKGYANREKSGDTFPLVMTGIVMIAMLEAARQGGPFWYERTVRQGDAREMYTKAWFDSFRGLWDMDTYLNVFFAMIEAPMLSKKKQSAKQAYSKWSRDNKMNNKVLGIARTWCSQMYARVYNGETLDWSKFYTVNERNRVSGEWYSRSDFGTEGIMETLYLELLKTNVMFDGGVLTTHRNRKEAIECVSEGYVTYEVDTFRCLRSFRLGDNMRVGSLMSTGTVTGKITKRFASMLFPLSPKAQAWYELYRDQKIKAMYSYLYDDTDAESSTKDLKEDRKTNDTDMLLNRQIYIPRRPVEEKQYKLEVVKLAKPTAATATATATATTLPTVSAPITRAMDPSLLTRKVGVVVSKKNKHENLFQ